jgi:post-segregation antitoxin (ccd killing protein)
MLTEVNHLETLRQKIEDLDSEAGSQSDYLDYGKPDPKQAKQTQEFIDQLNNKSRALKAELKDLIAKVRAQQPQAIHEWADLHINILQKIVAETEAGVQAAVRRDVAQRTRQEWEKVRAGEQEYVNINGHYLKDYRSYVRKIAGKPWWQFWK